MAPNKETLSLVPALPNRKNKTKPSCKLGITGMAKREQGRLLPDNLLNELQASELVHLAGEIQETPHT